MNLFIISVLFLIPIGLMIIGIKPLWLQTNQTSPEQGEEIEDKKPSVPRKYLGLLTIGFTWLCLDISFLFQQNGTAFFVFILGGLILIILGIQELKEIIKTGDIDQKKRALIRFILGLSLYIFIICLILFLPDINNNGGILNWLIAVGMIATPIIVITALLGGTFYLLVNFFRKNES